MKKGRFNTVNGIFIFNQVSSMIDEGKTKEEIVDTFFGLNGVFLWGSSSRESISNTVDEIIEIKNKPRKVCFFQKIFSK